MLSEEDAIKYQETLRLRILDRLKDLTSKIETGEEFPHGEQDYKFLIEVDDRLDSILNAWYY